MAVLTQASIRLESCTYNPIRQLPVRSCRAREALFEQKGVSMPQALELSDFSTGSGDELSTSQPKYEQLRDYVISQIQSGVLEAGAALPSENRLASIMNVARSTVRQALAGLEQDGLVKRIHGKGTFVCEVAPGQLYRAQDLFALILPETETAFYPSLQRSFESAAAELHNQVVVCNSHNDVDKQASAILQLIDLRVAGVAIVPPTVTATPAFHIRQLQKHDIPVVCCSRSITGTKAPLLGIPFEAVGELAGEQIQQAGHRRVAFVSTSRSTATTAYERGLQKSLGRSVEVESFVSSSTRPTDYSQVASECNAWLDRIYADGRGPTAIFCGFDSLAESLYMLLSQRGLRVPQDVSLVGFGGTRRGGGLSAHLSSVTIDEVGMGHQAIDLLSRMRRGVVPIDADDHRDIPLAFNTGSTLASPPAEAAPR